MKCLSVLCVMVVMVATMHVPARGDAQLDAELQALEAAVEGVEVIDLPATGELRLSADQALTVDDLRGVALDDDPPALGKREGEWDPRMTDEWPPGEAPYEAEGIAPFRFRHFTNEFSYGGWHNWEMHEYAVTHGFSVLSTYNHSPDEWTHLPERTRWLRWGGFVNWSEWLPEHGIGEGRYDQLVELDLATVLAQEGRFEHDPAYDQLMIDLEHPLLAPETLREQKWYPADAPADQREAFEDRYYEGYAQTYIAPVQAARESGWRNISLYGWQPFARTWWGLEDAQVDPGTYGRWQRFGRDIYRAVDILNPSVYCFYASPKNVAYTLANIDLNMRLVASMPERRPMRPYYWTLLHGGGAGERWWQRQPIPDEDVRAMTALCFFTGTDGLVLWNWSGTGNHHRPNIAEGVYVSVAADFPAPDTEGQEHAVARYDVLRIDAMGDDETVRFGLVDPAAGNTGVTDDQAVLTMPRAELEPLLRPKSAPVAAMVEGLALVRPLEYLLRHGEVRIDVPARRQFAEELPIARRVAHDGVHAIATYDPLVIRGGEPRTVVLEDFAGTAGLTVELPADAQVRVFVLKEAP